MPNENIPELLSAMRGGDVRALSRLMTIVENQPERLSDILGPVYASRRPARRIGVAGPPGAGKSTLIAALVREIQPPAARVGVLCIDPTSPLSGGALLGDRVRMADLFDLERVFIRSVASGGSLGGLAEASCAHALLLESFGVDAVFIETIGIGQVGYDIRDVAETLILVLVPESGDTIQALKSGIIELADIIVVNKSDRDGAEDIADSLRSVLAEPRDGRRIPVALTAARQGAGVAELWNHIRAHEQHLAESGRTREEDALSHLQHALSGALRRRFSREALAAMPAAREIIRKTVSGELDPYSASALILDALLREEK